MSALDRAEKALRDEVECQVQAQHSYSGPENGSPDYVDADLNYPAMCRAVLMAVRSVDRDAQSAATVDGWLEVEGGFETMWHSYIDAILNEEPK